MISDQYAVGYKLGNGGWSNAPVRISYYGGTLASPFNTNSGYISNNTSMSFVSIPAAASTTVYLSGDQFEFTVLRAGDDVSVRPSIKPVSVTVGGRGHRRRSPPRPRLTSMGSSSCSGGVTAPMAGVSSVWFSFWIRHTPRRRAPT
jgi:hypothetical protein